MRWELRIREADEIAAMRPPGGAFVVVKGLADGVDLEERGFDHWRL